MRMSRNLKQKQSMSQHRGASVSFKPDPLFSTVKCSSTSTNIVDGLSLSRVEERLRKW